MHRWRRPVLLAVGFQPCARRPAATARTVGVARFLSPVHSAYSPLAQPHLLVCFAEKRSRNFPAARAIRRLRDGQLIVLLPTFDFGLSRPVFVYAVMAKYHVPALRLVTV